MTEQIKDKIILWSDIQSSEVAVINPISQYGGWGVRMTSGGMAYIVSGKKGLKLLLRNGKSIMIGTQKEEELTLFLKEMGLEDLRRV